MKKGFTLVEIMIVVAIIGLLAAIAIPSFMRARTTSQKNACVNNIRQIEAGKEQYALEKGKTNMYPLADAVATWDALVSTNTLQPGYIKQFPVCPTYSNQTPSAIAAVGSYSLMVIGSNATCILKGTDPNFPHVLQ